MKKCSTLMLFCRLFRDLEWVAAYLAVMGMTEVAEKRRKLLQTAFLKKKERNDRFTVRAFATLLGINSGTVSKLLSGAQPISEKTFEKIKPVILSEVSLLDYEHEDIPKIDIEKFKLIAKWYHLAILELTYLSDFKSDPHWIASMLNISVIEAKDAVNRLFTLGFLVVDTEGRWVDADSDLSTLGTVRTHQVLMDYQRDILERAKMSIERFPVEERECTGLTVSLNSKELQQVRDILKQARRRVNELSEKSEDRDRVYQLSLAVYPLSKNQMDVQ